MRSVNTHRERATWKDRIGAQTVVVNGDKLTKVSKRQLDVAQTGGGASPDPRKNPLDYEGAAMKACPSCGSERTAPVVIGLPASELEESARRGEVILGGDVLTPELLENTRGCLDCEHRWATGDVDDERSQGGDPGPPTLWRMVRKERRRLRSDS